MRAIDKASTTYDVIVPKHRVQSLGFYLALGTLFLVLVAFAVSWWHLSRVSDINSTVLGTPSPTAGFSASGDASRSAAEAPSVGDGSRLKSQDEELLNFKLDQVILNVECRMLVGKGTARDVAVVTMHTEDGAEFAVLDNT